MKTAITVFMAAVVFSGLALPAGVYAVDPCNTLELSIRGGYQIERVHCIKGEAMEWGSTWAKFQKSGLHGPECEITVRAQPWLNSTATSFFQVHQYLCVFKAGDITVTHKSGSRPIYTTTKGKYEWDPGKIDITAFDPP